MSCDSRQFYYELDIGVARPTPDELAAVPHHFIACRSITDPYNVFSYEQEAIACINRLFQSHDHVVAVGGSGLYIEAICNGIALLPDPDPALRQRLQQQLKDEGVESLRAMLRNLDPDYYRTNLEPYLPTLSTARIEQQERIIATQVAWAQDFANCYPRLGAAMRTLRTSDDTKDSTSFETYLRGELSTYSQRTLDLYDLMVRDYAQAGENITVLTVRNTVLLGGFASLDEAEEAQA